MRKAKKEVRNLIFMLGGAVALAFLVGALFLHFFGSSGTYRSYDVLISPQTLKEVSSSDRDFVFNKIEFVVADSSGKGWGRYAVSEASYAEFYSLVSNLSSLPKLTDEQVEQFERVAPSTLTIFTQPKRREESTFQRVEFLDEGSLFRVQLRERIEEWAYFRKDGIYQDALELFAPESDEV